MKLIPSLLNKSRKIRTNKLWSITFLWLSVILLVALPEAAAWHDASQYFSFVTSPFAAVFLLVIFSLLGFFYTLFNHYGLAWILTFVPITLLSQINYMKSVNNSKPLFPWDILIVWEGLKAANSMADPRRVVCLTLAVSLTCLFCAIVILFILPKFPLKKLQKRWTLFTICLVTLAGIGLQQRLGHWSGKSGHDSLQGADLASEYHQKGFLVAFLNNITGLPKIHVEDYSQETIDQIADNLPKAERHQDNFRPDIIVFVSESYFDMTKLPHITYSAPINPFFRELKQQHSIRWFSPSFGGQTANAEFEMITGFPLVLFSPQVIPYRLYLRKKTPSVATALNAVGYKSIMIHPYHKAFWSRNTVIPNLGFDEFIALEDMKHTALKGEFVSDDCLVSEAIDVLEREQQPVYLYLMTIQNHYPFETGRYDRYDDAVKVRSNRLNDAENGLLESYANGILDSDRALKRLVEHIELHSDRPTLILFHGDHLPSLKGSEIYNKLGYDLSDNLSRYEVDGVVWSNYPMEFSNNAGYQMCYMPMKILEWARQPMSVYFRFLKQLSEDNTTLHAAENCDTASNENENIASSEAVRCLRLLVYDLMFGKAYSTKSGNDLGGTSDSHK